MYRLLTQNGDALSVPRLVFSRLAAPGGDDVRFRVALYFVEQGEADAASIAEALHIQKVSTVQQALTYWEGAGLLERSATLQDTELAPTVRKRLSTSEVAEAAKNNKALGGIVAELQRIFGGVVSQSDINVFLTLHLHDKMPADLILIAATHCASLGKFSARYIEKLLLSWRRDGIADATAADAYLQLLGERALREEQVAAIIRLPADAFSFAERKRIARWFEDFGYGTEMIESAKNAAGANAGKINYLDSILAKWHAKGYKTARDLQREGPTNLRVQGPQPSLNPDKDTLANLEYVPMKKRRTQHDTPATVQHGKTDG